MFSKRKLLLTGLFLLVAISLSLGLLLRVAPVAHASQQQPGGCQNSSDNLVRACISINQNGDILTDAYVAPAGESLPNCEIWIEIYDFHGLIVGGKGNLLPIACSDSCIVSGGNPYPCNPSNCGSMATHFCGEVYATNGVNLWGEILVRGDIWYASAWLTYGDTLCDWNSPDYYNDSGACTPYSLAISPNLAT